MVSLFASGRIVDIVLAITAIEAVILVIHHRRTGCGPAPKELLGYLLSGVCLMLALRAALVDAWWGWVALWLVAAFAAHLSDLRRRWPRRET
jgi:hypothetical protein